MNGLVLAGAVQQPRSDLPIVLMSDFLNETLVSDAAAAGVRAVVQKERAVEDLAGTVRKVIA